MQNNFDSAQADQQLDAAIIGGGIAGLWVYNSLVRQGYRVMLFEQDQLGCDQTLASQGMIHGGLKYALSGNLNSASEAIADMPDRWRACLNSQLAQPGDVDLAGVTVHSEDYYMFAERRGIGQLTSFFASRALRGRIDKVPETQWPTALQGLKGVVYRLNDFVMDTANLLTHLASIAPQYIYQHKITAQDIKSYQDGYLIRCGEQILAVRDLICCAGNGSVDLVDGLGVPLNIQQRPLKQVIVRPKHQLSLFAHCLTGVASAEPRLTITTDQKDGHSAWYLGGKIATSGVARSDEEQIAFARTELDACLGWLDWDDAEVEVLWVNRAEPKQTSGLKPDNAYVERHQHFLLCFPTKLALTPDLADRVLAELPPPIKLEEKTDAPLQPLDLRQATVGQSPWGAH